MNKFANFSYDKFFRYMPIESITWKGIRKIIWIYNRFLRN